MVEEGEIAPFFTEKCVGDGAEEFVLERKLDFGPVVLAFFPTAFSPPSSEEMTSLINLQKRLQSGSGNVVGISTNSPFVLEAFRSREEVNFELVSDMNQRVIQSYDISIDVPELGLYGVANRSIFVLNTEGEITYKWVAKDPSDQPDINKIESQIDSIRR